jgi:transmembrane sensor
MEPSDKKSSKAGKSWFWDLFRRTDSQKLDSLPDIAFRSSNLPDEKVEQQWQRLAQQLPHLPTADKSTSDTRKPRLALTRIAAVITLLLLAGGGVWTYLNLATHAYVTRYGETARIKLPDGSLVTLNSNSRLTFRNWESGKDREVWLEGEAFFEVQKVKRPSGQVKFVVHTNDLNVEVLGTRFNVFNRSQKTQVVLEEGKIRLRLNQQAQSLIEMQPGDLIELSEQQPAPVKRSVNPQNFTGWKDDLLVLNGKSLREVAGIISENYGLEVQIQTPTIMELRLQGSIPAHNLDELVEALRLATGIEIKRESNRLILSNP